MYEILKLNEISPIANKAFNDRFTLSKDSKNPDAIMLRSFSMHDYAVGSNLKCVARCGAGVNNIPVAEYTKKGIVVFNTPGANANAVKELVICSLFLASRKILPAIDFVNSIKGQGDEVPRLVEKGKSAYVGPEIIGKTLGVIGLGAIGSPVANAAAELGMTVYGYDPYISVDAAWGLSSYVRRETDLAHLFSICDYISLHTPLTPSTKGMINGDAISKMKDGVCIINCSRGELANNADIIDAVKSGKIARYITDFPTDDLIGIENIICIPHLGASTPEAEDNCALMAARQLVDFIENGNIVNSVNFPNCMLSRTGKCRLTIIHQNVQSMLVTITNFISNEKINISNMFSQCQGDYAYTIFDIDENIGEEVLSGIAKTEGVISTRIIR